MAEIGTFTAYGDVPARVGVYPEAELLANIEYDLLLENFAKIFTLPKNKGPVIRFRRLKPFALTTVPLTEGVQPAPTQFEDEIVDFRVKQYGAVYRYSDWVGDIHEENIPEDIMREASKQAFRTKELISWGYLRAGTQVIYSGGVTARADVADPITLAAIDGAVNVLKRNYGKMLTRKLAAGPNIGTEPIGRSYIGFGHIDQEFDFLEMDTFVPYYRYGKESVVSDYEIGAVRNVRIMLATHLTYFPNAGDSVAGGQPAEGMRSDNGVNANVYPFVIVAEDAFATIPLRGMEAVKVNHFPPKPRYGDTLGQIGELGWKYWYTGGILNQRWVVRVESAATATASLA